VHYFANTYGKNVLEVKAQKAEYILMSRQKNAGENHNIQIANKLKYMGTRVTNGNYIHEKFKSRINSVKSSYQPI
jgi:UDP-N-acetylglucosamine transferase subunit ALG13